VVFDMATPGVEVHPIATIGGDYDVNQVFLTNVRIPKANRIGPENAGWECAKYLLEFERGGGIFSGRLRSQLKRVGDAVEELRDRGIDVRTDAGLMQRFGEVCADLDCFEMMELRIMGALQPGQNPGPVSSILKLRASRMKQAIAELGVEILGALAMRWDDAARSDESVLPLLVPDYLNSRAFTIFGGASEVQLTIIAKSVGSA
jgi:acyl-CoA dehydrogenase